MGTIADVVMLLSIYALQVSVDASYSPCTADNCCVRNVSNTRHKTELYCSGIESVPAVHDTIHVL